MSRVSTFFAAAIRRRSLHILTLAFVALTVSAAPAPQSPPSTIVRLALVRVPEDVLAPLLPKFQAETGVAASIVYAGRDPFSVARDGKADLVISHYGHEGVEEFILGGHGLWPRAVFANQVVLLGPSEDPANVRGLSDPVEAFRRIARTKAPFVVNSSPGIKYIEDIIAEQSGERREWAQHADGANVEGPEAARAAAKLKGYVLWGLPPFIRLKQQGELAGLEPLVSGAPLFQRIMVAIVVNPSKVRSANRATAETFQRFLLNPQTQAAIETFRYPSFPHQAWFAAGRHNTSRE
jgi:tungstate transport system substrate-binding protein